MAEPFTCVHSEVCALVRRRDQGLRLKVPRDGEDGRACRAVREEPRAIFDDHALGPRKIERAVGPGLVADEEREPRIARAALPFVVRPVEARGPGGGGDQELRDARTDSEEQRLFLNYLALYGPTGLNPTSTLSRAISTAGPVGMKENSSFSCIIGHHSLMQRL